MAEHCKLLGDKTRLLLLALLREGEVCVCDLVALTSMSQPGVSQHLRKLKTGGLVTESKRGTWVYYALPEELPPYVEALLAHVPSQAERLSSVQLTCCEEGEQPTK